MVWVLRVCRRGFGFRILRLSYLSGMLGGIKANLRDDVGKLALNMNEYTYSITKLSAKGLGLRNC